MVARVQHPAPKFEATAVVDGSFETIKLDDYNGKVSDSQGAGWGQLVGRTEG
jgi:hypothetical protein